MTRSLPLDRLSTNRKVESYSAEAAKHILIATASLMNSEYHQDLDQDYCHEICFMLKSSQHDLSYELHALQEFHWRAYTYSAQET